MTIFQTLILSIVEGLSEFLPISSTAHLVLTSQILGIVQSTFVKSFEVIIQLGAILAVIVIYFKELIKNVNLWIKIVVAFLPSAVLGFILYGFIKNTVLGNGIVTSVALVVGGGLFIWIDKIKSAHKETSLSATNLESISLTKLVAIGLAQSTAMIPGVSRSAASIFGGVLTGLSKEEAVKFSFFLAIPTMMAATALDVYKTGFNFSQSETTMLALGFVGSFLTAILAIKTFIKFVQKHSFLPFGIYRIVLGTIWLFAIIAK